MPTVEQQTSEIHALLAETTSEAAVHLDGDGKVLYVNPTFTRMFGYKGKEILKQEVNRIFAERSREQVQAKDRLLSEKRRAQRLESQGLHEKGPAASRHGSPSYRTAGMVNRRPWS